MIIISFFGPGGGYKLYGMRAGDLARAHGRVEGELPDGGVVAVGPTALRGVRSGWPLGVRRDSL